MLLGGAGTHARVALPAGLVAPKTEAKAAALLCFLEGPAEDADGNVIFSDIAGNRLLKRTPKGDVWQSDDPGCHSPDFLYGVSGTGHVLLRMWRPDAVPRVPLL